VVLLEPAGDIAPAAKGVRQLLPPSKGLQKPGYPRFKGRGRFDSVEWPKDGDGARWCPETSQVYLKGIGRVKVSAHRPVQGRVKTIQIRREGRRWMLIVSCDDLPPNPQPETGRHVAVDLGIATFATTSDGLHVENPRWERTEAESLAVAQRRLARAQRRSKNQSRRRETVAARHRKIANQRKDFHHKTARRLVSDYDTIVVEDLSIRNMLRRARPIPDPDNPGVFLPNGSRAKSGLSRSISDAGWGKFVSILRAKAEDAGRTWIEVNPRHTSDRCEACGHAASENRVSQAEFRCQRCSHAAQADEHAARNILRAGLALHAHAA
jgi:putative transposase